ncbi:TRAP transporter small permease [Rhizobium halophytocola]|uniref:TRAP transporter small permease protein n=1 Tax=Rhizobium halophytocola TaxID=735519 RepID=A0ABS4E1D9_9HYPH|nr:TRAP transporter small permease [Rhizobium halophytocola]MBP1851768.1 TRAP-type C4-dicarboxylate transport system permease small subunit [Rhizobium halophytocola]
MSRTIFLLTGLADRLSRLLAFVAGIGVILMMVHVCADVVARVITGASLPATVEIVSYYYMIIVAFLPLAWVEWKEQMVSVEIIEFLLSPGLRRASDAAVALLSTVIYGVMTYATWATAMKNFHTGTFVVALQTKIVTWPGYILPTLGFALAALITAIRLFQLASGTERPLRTGDVAA